MKKYEAPTALVEIMSALDIISASDNHGVVDGGVL